MASRPAFRPSPYVRPRPDRSLPKRCHVVLPANSCSPQESTYQCIDESPALKSPISKRWREHIRCFQGSGDIYSLHSKHDDFPPPPTLSTSVPSILDPAQSDRVRNV